MTNHCVVLLFFYPVSRRTETSAYAVMGNEINIPICHDLSLPDPSFIRRMTEFTVPWNVLRFSVIIDGTERDIEYMDVLCSAGKQRFVVETPLQAWAPVMQFSLT